MKRIELTHFLIRIQTEMSREKKWRWPACKDLFSRNNGLISISLFFFRDFHREQISIEHSMHDLDSAVGKLDDILMTLFAIIAILIIAVALVTHVPSWCSLSRLFILFSFFFLQEAQLITVVTGAGALILGSFSFRIWSIADTKLSHFLGLSWLIGGTLTEVLSSIIFLLVKHPFDVGDRIILNKETFTVKEINLLSTVFLDSTSSVVQAPNNQLNTLVSFKWLRSIIDF